MKKPGLGLVLVLVVLSLLVIGWAPAESSATTFTVNDNRDSGDSNTGDSICKTVNNTCTLRAAIEQSNATAGGNTITVPAMTITLTSNTQLLVTRSVTINGAGQGSTIIDGNGATRVFSFPVSSGTASLSGLTIRNGNTTGNGGGIYSEANLTLTNVTVTNSRAAQGGGIYSQYDASTGVIHTLDLNLVTLSANTATSTALGQGGGGLFNGSTLTANGLTITGNSGYEGGGFYNNSYRRVDIANFDLSNNNAVYGGGMDNEIDQLVSLSNGTVSGNQAHCCDLQVSQPIGGGGIVNYDGTMTLTNVTVRDNTVTMPGGYGGGIVNIHQMTLNNVTVNGNSANYGAGIYNGNGADTNNSLVIVNSTISGNIGVSFSNPTRDAIGGGIFSVTYGHVTLASTTITRNSAVAAGGLRNEVTNASVVLRNTILAENTGTAPYPFECQGAITSGGYNLFGNISGCNVTTTSGDRTGQSPLLGPLQNNGGSTFTHALLTNSPAIDAGNPSTPGSGGNACPTADQRGTARPLDGNGDGSAICDIGALEFNGLLLTRITPNMVLVGSAAFTLTVDGAGFKSGYTVQWNGANRPTTYVSASRLTASISQGDVSRYGTIPITVKDPSSGATSNILNLVIFDSKIFLPGIFKH